MRFSNLSLLVLAEMRYFVRLARTWVFYFLTGLTCIGYWIVLGVIHGAASPYFPSAGALAPNYLIHHMGGLVLALFACGTALLVFAERKSRSSHSEIESNETSQTPRLETLTGKLLGAVGLMFFLAIGLIVFICGLGWLLDSTNASIGSSIESISVLAFFVWDLIPNFLLWGSLAIVLNSFLKSGWLIATIVLAISLLYYLVYAKFPSPILEPLLLHGTELASNGAGTHILLIGHSSQPNRNPSSLIWFLFAGRRYAVEEDGFGEANWMALRWIGTLSRGFDHASRAGVCQIPGSAASKEVGFGSCRATNPLTY